MNADDEADDEAKWRGFDRVVRAKRNVVESIEALERERASYMIYRDGIARLAMEKRRNGRILVGLTIFTALLVPIVSWTFMPRCDLAGVLSGFAYGAVWLAGLGFGAVVVRFLNKERKLWNDPSLRERNWRGGFEMVIVWGSIMWLGLIAYVVERFWVPACYSF